MKKDVLITLGVQVLIMISVLLTYKLAMVFYEKDGFAEYSLIKRNIALINPLLMLGLGAALTRYTALCVEDDKKIYDYFLSSFIFMLCSFLFLWGFITTFPEIISIALYGDDLYIKFLLPMYVSLVGLSLHVLVYSYFRGKLEMMKANILQLVSLGLIPLIGFYFADKAEEVYYYVGILTIVYVLPIIIHILYTKKIDLKNTYINAKKLIFYGIQRVPGDFGIMALFSLPVLVSTHKFGVEIGGYVAFGIALLNMSGQVVSPLGVIFLPKISQLIAKKKFGTIREYVKKLFILSIILSISILSLFYFFAGDILNLYLGYANENILSITKNISIGMIGFMLYVSLRGVVDAYHEKGINTVNIIIGLFVAIIVYIGLYLVNNLENINSIIYGFLLSIFIIAGLTLFVVKKSLREMR